MCIVLKKLANAEINCVLLSCMNEGQLPHPVEEKSAIGRPERMTCQERGGGGGGIK